MKRNVVYSGIFSLIIVLCILLIPGCEPEVEGGYGDTAWLEGTWENAGTGTEFTIDQDLTFICDLFVQPGEPGRVYGRLERPPSGGGSPDDFILRNMVGAQDGDPDNTYNDGNSTLRLQVGMFNNIIGSMAPNAEKDAFTFSTTVAAAQLFFGGTYTKKTTP